MGYSLLGVDSLFPVPLWRFRIDEPAMDDLLTSEITARRDREDGVRNRNRRGWQSARDLFQRTEPGQAQLAKLLSRVVLDAIRSLQPDVDLKTLHIGMNGWININPPGGYNSPHQHTDALLSGVYYLSVPQGSSENGGAIEFLSPHPVRQVGGLIKAAMFSERARVRPKKGDLLLFPGQLPHWVHPNDSGEERVTMAFNATIGARR